MAARAHASFTAGRYDEALTQLNHLTVSTTTAEASATDPSKSNSSNGGGDDFRTLHNRALCEHGAGGFSDPAKLEAALQSIQLQLRGKSRGGTGGGGSDDLQQQDDQAKAAGEEDAGREAAAAAAGRRGRPGMAMSATAATALLGSSRGAGAAAGTAGGGLAEVDADASVLLYNLSALHFQQQQYGAAQAILEHLFLHIEPLDDSLAIHVCLLLLDVLCHSARGNLNNEEGLRKFAAQSAAVLAFLERPNALSSPGGDSGGGGGGGTGGGDSGDNANDSAEHTEFAFRLHVYKAKVLLLQEQTKTSKKEIKSALEIFQRELRGVSDAGNHGGGGGGGAPQQQQQGMFVPVPPPGVQNMAALYLKANLEYLRDNHRKALKLLASCHGFQGAEEYSGPGEAVGPPYFNNMGCLHHKLRRHHVALHYFQKALEAFGKTDRGTENGGRGCNGSSGGGGIGRDGDVSPAPTCEVLYNTGLQLLLTEKSEQALRCFQRAGLLFHNRPHLWLRMAECSIAHHRQQMSRNSRSRRKEGLGVVRPHTGVTGESNSAGDSSNPPKVSDAIAADTDAAGGGRGPLPWTTVGKGQHRRVLLPTNSHAGGNVTREDGAATSPVGGRSAATISPFDEEGVAGETNGSVGAGGGRLGRGKRARSGGCSLAHASRCLHNVLYLCASRAQASQEAASSGATSFLGGQASVLGMSPRLVAKNLAASPSQQQQQQQQATGSGSSSHSTNKNGSAAGVRVVGEARSSSNDVGGVRSGGAYDGSGEGLCQLALVDLAYIHLGLNDPVSTLSYAGRVLSADHPSATYMHLAHLYAAEALCILGRPTEALEHLTPLSEGTSTKAASSGALPNPHRSSSPASTGPPSTGTVPTATATDKATATGGNTASTAATRPPDTGSSIDATGASARGTAGDGLSPEAAAEARATLHTNLAAVYVLQGNLTQAERCARTAMEMCPGIVSVLRMIVYVLIRQDNVAEALQVLKEGRLSHN